MPTGFYCNARTVWAHVQHVVEPTEHDLPIELNTHHLIIFEFDWKDRKATIIIMLDKVCQTDHKNMDTTSSDAWRAWEWSAAII